MSVPTGREYWGLNGNDSIVGYIGADTIHGGQGNDTLSGGAGYIDLSSGTSYTIYQPDVFAFKKGDGQDVITDFNNLSTNPLWSISDVPTYFDSDWGYYTSYGHNQYNKWHTIRFDDVKSSEVSLSWSNDKLTIKYGNGDQIVDFLPVLQQNGSSLMTALKEIEFSDGVTWDTQTFLNKIGQLNGTAAADKLIGIKGALNNIYGYSGDDRLTSVNQLDRLHGGSGNDVYIVKNDWVKIDELFSEGNDTVVSYVNDFQLSSSAYVETIIAGGVNDINLSGNGLNNLLIGNSGNNRLDGNEGNDRLYGRGGNDTLLGGYGNDIYYINSNDLVDIREYEYQGIDTVSASISYTLSNDTLNLSIEKLVLRDSGDAHLVTVAGQQVEDYRVYKDLSATGNDLNNTIVGSFGHNTLAGGKGSDLLIGGIGGDTYVFNRGDGSDTVVEQDILFINFTKYLDGVAYQTSICGSAQIDSNTIDFSSAADSSQLWFVHKGNDLQVSVIGTADKVTLKNWYTGYNNNQIFTNFKASDGKVLLESEVESLVNAMAAFSVPAANQTTLPTSYQSVLNPVLAANWS